MERTKKNKHQSNTEQKVYRFKKVGGGSFRMASGRIIKPNEVFHATMEEVPLNFRNVVVLQEDEKAEPQPIMKDPNPVYEAVPLADVETPMETVFEPVDEENTPAQDETLEELTPQLHPVGGGWFDIINTSTGKVLNEKRLRFSEAEKFIAELNA